MRGIAQYNSVRLDSASKEELVVLLFEGAVKYQLQAKEALERGDNAMGRTHLRRVREIFGELIVALDHSVAPELAANLTRLYAWVIRELGHAGMSMDTRLIDNTLAVTQNLLEGWSSALRPER